MELDKTKNDPDMNNREYDVVISFIKVVAMLLIINSHADLLFPNKFRFLATGGAIGNELFFFVGGLLLKKRTNDKITSFIWRKYIRLYIPTYIMSVFLFIVGYIHLNEFNSFVDIFHLLIWPSQFWFVSAFFVFSILTYIIAETPIFEQKCFAFYTVVFWIALFVLYHLCIPDKSYWIVEDKKIFGTTIYFKCIYSFYVFTLGYFIQKQEARYKKRKTIWLASFLLSLLMFYLFKYFLNRSIIPMELQIISQPITVICVISLYFAARMLLIINNTNAKIVINSLGVITLEAFLVQFQVIQRVSNVNIIFPINYVISILLIASISFVFHYFSEHICDFSIRISTKRS